MRLSPAPAPLPRGEGCQWWVLAPGWVLAHHRAGKLLSSLSAWGSAVPSHGTAELRPLTGAHSWEGEAKLSWVQEALGTRWGALG